MIVDIFQKMLQVQQFILFKIPFVILSLEVVPHFVYVKDLSLASSLFWVSSSYYIISANIPEYVKFISTMEVMYKTSKTQATKTGHLKLAVLLTGLGDCLTGLCAFLFVKGVDEALFLQKIIENQKLLLVILLLCFAYVCCIATICSTIFTFYSTFIISQVTTLENNLLLLLEDHVNYDQQNWVAEILKRFFKDYCDIKK